MDRTDLLYRRIIDDVLLKTKKEFESYGWEEDVVNHKITALQRLWESELTKLNSIPKPYSLRKQLTGPGTRHTSSDSHKRTADAALEPSLDPSKRPRLPYQSLTSPSPTLSLAATQQLAAQAQQLATYAIPPNPYDPTPSLYMAVPTSSPAAYLPPLPTLSTNPIPTPATTLQTSVTSTSTSTSTETIPTSSTSAFKPSSAFKPLTSTFTVTSTTTSTPTTIPQRDGGDDDDVWLPQSNAPTTTPATTSTSTSSAPTSTSTSTRRRDDMLDREELGPEDDEEEDATPAPTNLILCQYEKVQHGKNNHWKVTLKNGIMNVDGRDYVFGKASAEWDW